jgi:hypothetical protein
MNSLWKTPIVFPSRAAAATLTVCLSVYCCSAAWSEEPPPPQTPPAANSAAPDESASPSARQKRIARLIEQLGDKDYFVRQRAQEELLKAGFEAFDALSAATTNDDLEIAARAKYIIRTIRMDWTTPEDPPEVQDLLQDYEDLDAGNRRVRIQALAELPGNEGIAALGRLVRFEKSAMLSKEAAVALLSSAPDAPQEKNLIEPLRKIFAHGNRPTARWLRAWLQPADDPRAFERRWTGLIEAEQQVLRQTPAQTTPQIVAALWRFQSVELKKRGENEAADRALQRMIAPENVKIDSLQESLDALVEQKAWPVAAMLLARYPGPVSADPLLMYTYAETKAEQGQTAEAGELAGRAFRLNPGKDPSQVLLHKFVADKLAQRGLFPWAKREYEYLLQQKFEQYDVRIIWDYSVILHEQGDDLRAAEVIESISDAKLTQRINRDALPISSPEILSQKYYYFACHWLSRNDPVKQREALEKAFLTEPGNVEVLIAYYRLPGTAPEVKRQIREQIGQKAAELREAVALQPGYHLNYNEYAWLVANTEGNLDEALRFSQESLKIIRKSPELIEYTGGYLDTLARVHYARGEYAAAVTVQTQALRLDPHSPQIAKQLALFQKALKKKKKT